MSPILDISTEEGYNLASALRGPDIQDKEIADLKWITTGRLRTILGVEKDDVVMRTTPEIHPEDYAYTLMKYIKESSVSTRNALTHYTKHLVSAFGMIDTDEARLLKNFCQEVVWLTIDPHCEVAKNELIAKWWKLVEYGANST
jgi:hypothetical protein